MRLVFIPTLFLLLFIHNNLSIAVESSQNKYESKRQNISTKIISPKNINTSKLPKQPFFNNKSPSTPTSPPSASPTQTSTSSAQNTFPSSQSTTSSTSRHANQKSYIGISIALLINFSLIVGFIFLLRYIIRKIKIIFLEAIYNPKPITEIKNTIENDNTISRIKDSLFDFNETAFIDRVKSIFFEIQNAKIRKDTTTIQPYVTEGFYNKFKFMLNQLSTEHKKIMIKDLGINTINIADFIQEDDIYIISVLINFSMIEAIIDENNNSRIYSGSLNSPKTFLEQWTFVKDEFGDTIKRSEKFKRCKNCGASINSDQTTKCEFCGAILPEKQDTDDWLLADIKAIQ